MPEWERTARNEPRAPYHEGQLLDIEGPTEAPQGSRRAEEAPGAGYSLLFGSFSSLSGSKQDAGEMIHMEHEGEEGHDASRIDEKATQSSSRTSDDTLYPEDLRTLSDGLSVEMGGYQAEPVDLKSMDYLEMLDYFTRRISLSYRELGRRGFCVRHLGEDRPKPATVEKLAKHLYLNKEEAVELRRAASEFRGHPGVEDPDVPGRAR